MKKFILSVLILFYFFYSSAQKTTFTQLVEHMHFGVFARQPNTQIIPFMKKYFPSFVSQGKNENDGWAYNFKQNDFTQLDTTMHSFNFSKHPIVKAKFSYGRFDLVTYEKSIGFPLIANWSIFFSFDNIKDANNCFDSIYNIFSQVCKDKVIFSKNNRKIAQLTYDKKLSETNCVEFVLVNDEIIDNRFKIYFSYGSRFTKD